jgi:hypothetical protein
MIAVGTALTGHAHIDDLYIRDATVAPRAKTVSTPIADHRLERVAESAGHREMSGIGRAARPPHHDQRPRSH